MFVKSRLVRNFAPVLMGAVFAASGCGERYHEKIVTESQNRFALPEKGEASAKPASANPELAVQEKVGKVEEATEFESMGKSLSANVAKLDLDVPAAKAPVPVHAVAPVAKIAKVAKVEKHPSAAHHERQPASEAQVAKPKETYCSTVEYPGNGAAKGISLEDWKLVESLFAQSRGDLLRWLVTHSKRFGAPAVAYMTKSLSALKLRNAPEFEQADIAWRGVAILGADVAGAPVVDVGAGFVQLVKDYPKRARFELTRTLAQAWAPCAMEKQKAGQPWASFLRCMKIDTVKGCSAGAYSEAGWAVSSAVAMKLAEPGCDLLGFSEPTEAQCVDQFLVPFVSTAGVSGPMSAAN